MLKSYPFVESLPACFGIDFYSYKIWIGGQRLDPNDVTSPFVWKPYPNVPHVPMSQTFWKIGQPDAVSTMESCISYWSEPDYMWNNADCVNKKCALCEADPILL